MTPSKGLLPDGDKRVCRLQKSSMGLNILIETGLKSYHPPSSHLAITNQRKNTHSSSSTHTIITHVFHIYVDDTTITNDEQEEITRCTISY